MPGLGDAMPSCSTFGASAPRRAGLLRSMSPGPDSRPGLRLAPMQEQGWRFADEHERQNVPGYAPPSSRMFCPVR